MKRELPARAMASLESAEMRNRAWGAYLCGSLLVKACGPKLAAELEKATSLVAAPEDGPEFFYVQASLDSLIRLQENVALDLVMRFDPRVTSHNVRPRSGQFFSQVARGSRRRRLGSCSTS